MSYRDGASFPAPRGNAFRIGLILSVSWAVYARHFVKFIILAIITNLPSIAMTAFTDVTPQMMMRSATGWIVIFAGVLLGAIAHAASAYGVYEELRGNDFTIGTAIGAAGRNIWAILAASLLIFLAMEIGIMLLIVPGLMIICRYYVTIPACVAEQLGPLQSMKRSAELTSGYRWPILGLLAIVYGVSSIPSIVFLRSLMAPGPSYMTIYTIITVTQILFASFITVVSATSYFQLRLAKEGVDIEHLTTVFD